MMEEDLAAVDKIAAEVHPNFPEDAAVPAERLRLAPAGCFALADGGTIAGYVVSHPWRAFPPPKLNTLLGAIPEPAACWYIHDLALLPSARGHGHAGVIVERLAAAAGQAGLPAMSLTAVSGSAPFWARHGFVAEHGPEIAAALASYGTNAAFMVRRLSRSA
jgi:GNAT superfamily N-acetyltransferase